MTQKTDTLSATLQRLRDKARLSQRALAATTVQLGAKVSEATIRAIENDQTIPKPVTLRRLANALARDPFSGDVNQPRADGIFRELLEAAGHASFSPPPAEPEDSLRRHIELAFGGDARQIEDFLIQASGFDHADKLFILQTVSWLRTLIPAGRAVRERHALFPS